MYFYDAQHEENFGVMLQKYPEANKNSEYRVACYIIAVPEIFLKAMRKQWENPFDDWMNEEDFSTGYLLLIALGLHLYGGGRHPFNLLHGIEAWDAGLYQVFVQACEIRRGWA